MCGVWNNVDSLHNSFNSQTIWKKKKKTIKPTIIQVFARFGEPQKQINSKEFFRTTNLDKQCARGLKQTEQKV